MMDNLNKILKEEAIFEGHSVEAREAIMEHVKRGVPLCDSIFRTHSDAYFETFNLARKLYKEGLLEGLDWESVEMLESNIGETAVVDGEVVYLDVPYLCEDEDEEGSLSDYDKHNGIPSLAKAMSYDGKTLDDTDYMVAHLAKLGGDDKYAHSKLNNPEFMRALAVELGDSEAGWDDLGSEMDKDLDETRPDKMTTDTKEKERQRAEHFRLRDYSRHEDDEDAEERKERRKEQMSGYDDDYDNELDRIKKLSKS